MLWIPAVMSDGKSDSHMTTQTDETLSLRNQMSQADGASTHIILGLYTAVAFLIFWVKFKCNSTTKKPENLSNRT